MHPLVSLLLAFASVSSFANWAQGPGQRHLYRGTRLLGPAKRADHDPSPADQHVRMAELMARPGLRYLMFMPAPIDAHHAEFGFKHSVLSDEMTGPFVRTLVQLEVAMAKRFKIPFARVSAETDLLLNLAAPTADVSAKFVLDRLESSSFLSLGPAYDDLFLRALRLIKVRGRNSHATAARFLPNLSRALGRSVRAAWVVLENARSVGADSRRRAFLEASLPPRKLDLPTVEIDEPHAGPDVDTAPIKAACVRYFFD